MNDAQLHTLEQLRAFLNGTVAVGFSVGTNERYEFITRILRRFGYSFGYAVPTEAWCCAFWGV